jgi:hypothetical protein
MDGGASTTREGRNVSIPRFTSWDLLTCETPWSSAKGHGRSLRYRSNGATVIACRACPLPLLHLVFFLPAEQPPADSAFSPERRRPMSTPRPEILVFMSAADTIIQRASGGGVPFSDE